MWEHMFVAVDSGRLPPRVDHTNLLECLAGDIALLSGEHSSFCHEGRK